MNLDDSRELDSEILSKAAHKTAISRTIASRPARTLLPHIQELIKAAKTSSMNKNSYDLIDYGCGRGKDLEFYQKMGIEAFGYDPHPAYGFIRPEKTFYMGTNIFVLNVIPTPKARIAALKDLYDLITPGGYALIVTRSKETIEYEANKNAWKKWGDGYISDERKKTFQKGLSVEELKTLGSKAGFKNVENSWPDVENASIVLLRKT